MEADAEAGLRVFRETGRTEALLDFVRRSGRPTHRYEQVLNALAPVLEPMSFGEHPRYEELDKELFESYRAETTDIVEWAAGSRKADLKSVALSLMGALGWPQFIPELSRSLDSSANWERHVAISALGQMRDGRAFELLRSALGHPDPDTRRAAHAALAATPD
jgi:hypothetical protein